MPLGEGRSAIKARYGNGGLEKSRHDRLGSHAMHLSLSRMKSWNTLGGAVTVAIVLQGCTFPSSAPVDQKPVPVVDRSAKVRELQKQIRERDQRIAELEAQLEALKLIDQDSKNQKPLFRPPTTLQPLE